MGNIPEVNYGVKWNPPPFDLLDRKNEAEADELELRIGKKTWAQLVGDQGIDPVKQLEDIKRWKSLLEEAGVSFNPKVAANPNNTGGTDDGGTNQTANPKA